MWFAAARLAISTTGVRVWSKADGELGGRHIDVTHTYVSRAVDKSALHIASVYYGLFDHEHLRRYEHGMTMSDCASNMKSAKLVGTVGVGWFDKFNLEKLRWCFLCPKHGKTIMDGHFGSLSHIRTTAAERAPIIDPQDLVRVYRAHFEREAELNPR